MIVFTCIGLENYCRSPIKSGADEKMYEIVY